MKHIKNRLLIYSLITFILSTQAYPMGAIRPKTTPSSSSAPSTVGKVLPLIETILPLFGSVSPIFPLIGNMLPLFGKNIGTQPTSGNLVSSLGTAGNLVSTLGTIISTVGSIKNATTQVQQPSAVASATGAYVEQIKDLAGNSSCADYSWKNSGVAPAGYIKGVALSFARSVCRLKKAEQIPTTLATILGRASTNNPLKDALSFFKDRFSNVSVSVDTIGAEPLRAVYTLGMGLGIKQNAGVTCNTPTNLNAINAFSVLSKLYTEYKSGSSSRCFLDVFKEGTNCTSKNSCPALATELAMTMLRINPTQYTTIANRDVEIAPACDQLLQDVQNLVDQDPVNVCQDIF